MTHKEYDDQGMELRAHGTAAFPIAVYSGDWANCSVQLHWHDELEVGFVTGGAVLLTAGKEKLVLDQGDGFFVNSGIPHAFSAAAEPVSRQRSLVFDPVLVGGRFDSVFWQRYVQPVAAATALPWLVLSKAEPWQAQALEAARQAWQLCQEKPEGYELEVRWALSRLIALLRRHLPPERPVQARRTARENERIRVMMRYIQDHFDENLTIRAIAASAAVSPSECLRCFHSTIGLTPIQYAKYCRVQQAAELLQTTDRRIGDIGAACGFQDMSYFAKAFREILGQTPGEYRTKHRELAGAKR